MGFLLGQKRSTHFVQTQAHWPSLGEGFLGAGFGRTAGAEDSWGMPLREEWVVRVWKPLGKIRVDL